MFYFFLPCSYNLKYCSILWKDTFKNGEKTSRLSKFINCSELVLNKVICDFRRHIFVSFGFRIKPDPYIGGRQKNTVPSHRSHVLRIQVQQLITNPSRIIVVHDCQPVFNRLSITISLWAKRKNRAVIGDFQKIFPRESALDPGAIKVMGNSSQQWDLEGRVIRLNKSHTRSINYYS